MNMDIEAILFASAYFLSTIACQFSLFVIRKYHQSKPLGMQTLLGEVIVIFSKVLALTDLLKNATFCITELFAPFPRIGDGNNHINICTECFNFHVFIYFLHSV